MLTNQYSGEYFAIIDKAKSEDRKKHNGTYYEAHHTYPKSLVKAGLIGLVLTDTERKEKVLLSGQEHFRAHELLIEMYEGQAKYKMKHALWSMMRGRNSKKHRRIYSAEQYEIAKKHQAEVMSYSGKGNQYAKGQIPWNKDNPWSEENKQKMKGPRGPHKKKRPPRTETHRRNLSLSLKGRFVWNKGLTKETDDRVFLGAMRAGQSKKGRATWMKGRKHSNESNEKNRLAHLGKPRRRLGR